MISLNEARVFDAIAMLGTVSSAAEVGAGAGALVAAMGMERYVVVGIRAGTLAALLHNAPDELKPWVESWQDALLTKARATRLPFTWGRGEGGEWREQQGDAGFRSGLVGATWDGEGSGCVLMLSGSASQVDTVQAKAALAYALMAAVTLNGPLERLTAADVPLGCPLTGRELQCLVYAMAGKSSKETARALVGIEERTIRHCLERAREKLQVKTSQAAAAIAVRKGWLDVQRALDLAA